MKEDELGVYSVPHIVLRALHVLIYLIFNPIKLWFCPSVSSFLAPLYTSSQVFLKL